MNSLGWSRRDPDLPVNTAQQTGGLLSSIKSLNPFGDSGYVRLPTTEGTGAPLPGRNRREEEEGWFACKSTYLTFSFPTRCTVPASAATRCDVQWRLLLVWLDCLSVLLPKIAYLKAD